MSPAEPAWLVVGLGNPGTRYEFTRHNAGARALERLAKRLDVKLRSTRSVARMGEVRSGGARLFLARPTTFMNESGRAVAALTSLKKLAPENVIVLHDEIDLPAGSLKVKIGGGSAGNRGIESVARSLGSKDFYRVRIGVGRPPHPFQEPADFVLEQMSKKDALELFELEERAGDAALSLVHDGLEATRNRFNSTPKQPEAEE
ncbi:MAG TPA: aminoacyl-tRNA hydrolase [Actinomycetota bacterium]|nr:aminoacyl-tRNA hydrolase [Actinomycetota bacterium]